jgi:cell division protein FtsI (penicillin-binding protein 3)
VNGENSGVSGLEKAIDDASASERLSAGTRPQLPPFRISIDIGVQHGVESTLADAMRRYEAQGAAAILMDVSNGEVVASASLPAPDPGRPADFLDSARPDRVLGGTYELGSIFKAITIAEGVDAGAISLEALFDVREPLRAGPFVIKDAHPPDRLLSVRDIFLQSSNVGAGMIALRAGSEAQRAFLGRFGLLAGRRTEAGVVPGPQMPDTWGRAETITISYGHGLAVAPIQFTAALSSLVNGGSAVTPTFRAGSRIEPQPRVISPATSAAMRELFRLNVTHASGTGRRAEVAGYRIGGKTGTAEMAGIGGYQKKAVISSFAAAFPMDAPRYALLVMLFEPKGQTETRGQITAGVNAAPTAGRIVARIAPILGVAPRGIPSRLAASQPPPARIEAAVVAPPGDRGAEFDAPDDAQ